MTPDYLRLLQQRRLQYPDHADIIANMLASLAATDIFEGLKAHYDEKKKIYEDKLAGIEQEEKLVEVKEDLVVTAGEDGVLEASELLEKKKDELIEIATTLGVSTEGNKPDLVEAILSHKS